MRFSTFLLCSAIFALASHGSGCKNRGHSSMKGAGFDYDGYKTVEEFRGREIWYKSANNGKFHTYTLPQRLGVGMDWFRVLRTDRRTSRFEDWGIINDPDCVQGDASTFFLDKCPDDIPATDGRRFPKSTQPFFSFVGKADQKWDDPGCYISGAYNATDCELGFGTSTGVMGYRKFPNPRFNKQVWDAAGGWAGYSNNPMDGSVEPPILIGTSCGSCHISFDPRNPPADPNAPKRENLHGLVGNQYQMIPPVVSAGLAPNSVEWQAVIHNRPGTVDTSAHATDWVFNPGTVNALINLDKRPRFIHKENCNEGLDANACRERLDQSTAFEKGAFGILKGGEDDIGGVGAVMRVYINIGTCAWSSPRQTGQSSQRLLS